MKLWDFLIQQSECYRHLLLHLVQVLEFGELSTFWKDMGTTTPAPKVKELSNLWRAEALPLSVQPLFRFFADFLDKEVKGAEHT